MFVSRVSNAALRVPPVKRFAVLYTNTRYGFTVTLPDDWKGYGAVEGRWRGYVLLPDGTTGPDTITGPQVTIRHPLWTESQPRQDIPIMVFTRAQWRSVTQQTLVVSAAPIGPRALARNARYVLALPPRYNFAARPGAEQVDTILAHHAVRPL